MDLENIDFISRSEADTTAFAGQLCKALPDGGVIALYGDLGAGKTVFARGFARALGITEPVSSPTYTILQEYPAPGNRYLYHLDLYRISDERSALAFGVDEYLESGEYVLIEWPERITGILPDNTLKLKITHTGETERHWTVMK
ncbi:MAG: tRNA (adenosine(37)-N6)-threonylcarbamoyltransferase complex ATPase subunit type 1 TsaE [Lentisphaeria bacterium]|nr:tRNA (adenosine(37)-N6)-threonylcarbamoyltransferase complex ATPase subunit type 1 TsaE [Lentisphaeria bacterium]